MKTTSIFSKTLFLLVATLFAFSCSDDEAPAPENEEEEIAQAVLTFTPATGSPLVFTWSDPDGDGPQAPVLTPSTITLAPNMLYELNIELLGPNGENISEEVAEEAEEHMFFYGWSPTGLFADPTGDGNIDNRDPASNPVNYLDTDINNMPLGLETSWRTGAATTGAGVFRIVLKHQPDSKSASSTVNDGESDMDISWPIIVQ